MNDQQDVHIYNGIQLSHKQEKIMSFAAIWLQREFLILNEENQKEEKQIPYDITSIWNLIYGTGDPVYKTETDHGQGEQTSGCWGDGEEGRERDGWGVWGWWMQIVTFRMDGQWGPTIQHRKLCMPGSLLHNRNWRSIVNQLYFKKYVLKMGTFTTNLCIRLHFHSFVWWIALFFFFLLDISWAHAVARTLHFYFLAACGSSKARDQTLTTAATRATAVTTTRSLTCCAMRELPNAHFKSIVMLAWSLKACTWNFNINVKKSYLVNSPYFYLFVWFFFFSSFIFLTSCFREIVNQYILRYQMVSVDY